MGGQSFLAFGLEIANFGLTIAGINLSVELLGQGHGPAEPRWALGIRCWWRLWRAWWRRIYIPATIFLNRQRTDRPLRIPGSAIEGLMGARRSRILCEGEYEEGGTPRRSAL